MTFWEYQALIYRPTEWKWHTEIISNIGIGTKMEYMLATSHYPMSHIVNSDETEGETGLSNLHSDMTFPWWQNVDTLLIEIVAMQTIFRSFLSSNDR